MSTLWQVGLIVLAMTLFKARDLLNLAKRYNTERAHA